MNVCQRTLCRGTQMGARRQIISWLCTDAFGWERSGIICVFAVAQDRHTRRSRNWCWTTSAGTKRRTQRFAILNKVPTPSSTRMVADSQDRRELCSFGMNRKITCTHYDCQVWDFHLTGLAAGGSGHFEGVRHITRCGDSGLTSGSNQLKRQTVFL